MHCDTNHDLPADVPYVVALGGANMDISASSAVQLLQGDSNPGRIRCSCGGVARNIAENLARLGNDVRLVSVVGDDVFGKTVRDLTQSSGVDVNAVQVVGDWSTSTYLSLHGPDGDMAVAINDMEIMRTLDPAVLQQQRGLLAGARAIVVDCNVFPESMQWLFSGALHVPVFVDGVSVAKCQRLKPHLARIHTLKVNALEAQALTGIAIDSPKVGLHAAQALHQSGVGNVVVSLGKDGAAWCDAEGKTGLSPGREAHVVNTSGAGDALLAGVVHGYLKDQAFALAVDFGLRCAEFTVSSPHSNHPDLSAQAVTAYVAGLAPLPPKTQ